MKTTFNKREIAQRERAKNLAIYNEAAAIAREVFNLLTIEAGTYSAAAVATAIEKSAATWDAANDDYLSELVKIEIDGFSCRFPRGLVFNILNKMGTGYSITSAARVTFERTAEENDRRAADIETAAERQAQTEAQAQAAAEAAARAVEEKRARRRENDRRRRAEKKAQAAAERAQAQAEAEAAEAARRAAMTPADIKKEIDRQRRRAESSARRGRYIYEHSTKFSCGSDIELINKIIVVTIEANGQKIFKCWAVGVCDSFYYICGSLTENNYIKDSNRSYKKENRGAVANWIYLTRQAAQKNGWNISIYSETPAPAAGYFVPAISTAAEDTIKRAQAAAAPAADSETPAAVPSIESTTANDDTAAPAAADIETRETPAALSSIESTTANDDTANDDTRRPAVVLGIETGDTPANDDTAANGEINAVFRYLLRAAVVAAVLVLTFANDRPTIATARPAAADIETSETPAAPSIESTTANDGAPAVLVPVANDDTPRHRSTRPRRRAVRAAKVAAPAADIESTTARDTTANDDTARALLLTVANDTTTNDTARALLLTVANDTTTNDTARALLLTVANDTTTNDTARTIVAAPTLYEAGEITETSDTAAAVVPAAADIESTTANDDTQTAATAADIETSDTAAPSIESMTANDDTANDDTANDGAPATIGTTTPAAPAAGSPAAVATPCPPAAPVAPVAPIIL